MNAIDFTPTPAPKPDVAHLLANGWVLVARNPLTLQRKGCPRKYELRANGALVMV